MHRIYLLNRKQFVSDLQSKSDIFGTLHFVKKYHDVELWLNETNLIPELQNIIMTYVNDELFISYETKRLEHYKFMAINVNCQIWLQDYKLSIRYDLTHDGYLVYTSNSDIFNSDISITSIHGIEISSLSYNNFFELFFKQSYAHDKSYLRFEKFSTLTYKSVNIADWCKTINITNMRKFRNLLVIMKLIDLAIGNSGIICEKIDISN